MPEENHETISPALRPSTIPAPESVNYTTLKGRHGSLRRYRYQRLRSDAIRIFRQLPRSHGFELADGTFVPSVEIIHTTYTLPTKHEYEAISYVWGDCEDCGFIRTIVKRLLGRITVGDGHLMVSKSLLAALQHLVLNDHSRNLWADQICINQSDLPERASQVAIMGMIFSHAWSTNVWLGPKNQSTDAVFDAIARLTHGEFDAAKALFQDGTRAVRAALAVHMPKNELRLYAGLVGQLMRHSWFERLWTFQEAVMSQRLNMV
ncbi:hypothetical protein AMS68_003971 [Peltaster fructicola]|uniref:Heterokaryon incompatibility domain-containing protein n=1 Tax=Peltaster fructicola TaxID=286661 RepID=A0A6H0XUP5_9PEZI|nr:hypothetical protein AMS68_003971 [Peltaster fructicola]